MIAACIVVPNYNANNSSLIIEVKKLFATKTNHEPLSEFEFRYLGGTQVGYCNFAQGPNQPPVIYIDANWWQSANRDFKIRLAIHEMGHCEFGLLHQFAWSQIMYHTLLDIPFTDIQWTRFLQFIENCGDPMASVNGRGYVPDRIEDMCLQ